MWPAIAWLALVAAALPASEILPVETAAVSRNGPRGNDDEPTDRGPSPPAGAARRADAASDAKLNFISSESEANGPAALEEPQERADEPLRPFDRDAARGSRPGEGVPRAGGASVGRVVPPPGALQLDMSPARGGKIHSLRMRNRLCHRHVLLPEGPKYDSRGRVYLAEFSRVRGRNFSETRAPRLLLPRCCNCCRKSALGCE